MRKALNLKFLVLVGMFVIVLCVPVWSGLSSYCFNAFDLGIYARALTAMGEGQINPWISVRQVNILFDHFDPILLPVSFLTRLISAPSLLIVGEWFAIFVASLAFFVGARRRQIAPEYALLAIFAIFFSSAMARTLHYPGHPSTWSIALLSWCGFFFREGKVSYATLCLIGCFLFKEEYAVYGFVLTPFLWRENFRKQALLLGIFSCLWLFLVFGLRRLIATNYVGYESSFLNGVTNFQGFLDFYLDWDHFKSFVLMFLPLFLFYQRPFRWDSGRRILFVFILTMVAVRLFGQWWFPHRSAQVFVVALWLLIPRESSLMPRIFVLKWAALVLLSLNAFQIAAKVWTDKPYRNFCPRSPERLSAIAVGLSFLSENRTGEAFVAGNLVPALHARDSVRLIEQKSMLETDYYFFEKHPFGDPWPLKAEDLEKLRTEVIASRRFAVVLDNDYVFLARKVGG